MNDSILAVDGGQSTIRVRHSDGRSASVPGVSWAGPGTIDAVAARIGEAWNAAGAPDVDVAVLGLTTVPPDDASRLLAGLVSDSIGANRIVICDDGVTTHAGVLGGSWGIALAVGTGVACVAAAPSGSASIIGGHGYLLGDEGGGFWLGRAGIGAALRAHEGRAPNTALTGKAVDDFGDLADLHVRLAADTRAVDRIAQFAPAVVEASEHGDAVAARIVAAGVAELVDVARAAWHAAGERPTTPTVVTGRLASVLGDHLRSALSTIEGIDVRPAAGDALDGGLALTGVATRYDDLIHTWTREPT